MSKEKYNIEILEYANLMFDGSIQFSKKPLSNAFVTYPKGLFVARKCNGVVTPTDKPLMSTEN